MKNSNCKHKIYVKAGKRHNTQYFKCKDCKRFFKKDKDKRYKFNIKQFKKDFNSIKGNYEERLRILNKGKYKNKKLPSLSYVYKLFKQRTKKPSYKGFFYTINTDIPIARINGKDILIKKNIFVGYKVKKKSYEKMKKLIRILKNKKISHNDFFKNYILKNLKTTEYKKGEEIFKIYKNSWDNINKRLDRKKLPKNNPTIKLLNDIILENI